MRSVALFLGMIAVALTAAGQAEPETTVLDIDHRRIERERYHNSVDVHLAADDGRWHLRAGAAIDAARVTIDLHNVRGRVEFRADTSRLQALLERHRGNVRKSRMLSHASGSSKTAEFP
jgi:hypothetical protein